MGDTTEIEIEQVPQSPRRASHWHWLFLLALLPLAFNLLSEPDTRNFETRLSESLQSAPENIHRYVLSLMNSGHSHSDILKELPGSRLIGAALPSDSMMHWLFAIISANIFFIVLVLIANENSINPLIVVGAGIFTGTIGIVMIYIVQFVAMASVSGELGGAGIFNLIGRIIAFSYFSALNPETNIVLSFIGYTIGVGLCEEFVKAFPLLIYYHDHRGGGHHWRLAMLLGLASGVGFGIAEGIMYSSGFYNGITSWGAYGVRFISIVALHAMWAGTAAIEAYRCRDSLFQNQELYYYIAPLGQTLGVVMVLHGLYDTFLKKQFLLGALVIALLSFFWMLSRMKRVAQEQ